MPLYNFMYVKQTQPEQTQNIQKVLSWPAYPSTSYKQTFSKDSQEHGT